MLLKIDLFLMVHLVAFAKFLLFAVLALHQLRTTFYNLSHA